MDTFLESNELKGIRPQVGGECGREGGDALAWRVEEGWLNQHAGQHLEQGK